MSLYLETAHFQLVMFSVLEDWCIGMHYWKESKKKELISRLYFAMKTKPLKDEWIWLSIKDLD